MANNSYTNARQLMVTEQIIGRGISEKRLIDAFIGVPRQHFVPEDYKNLAYSDRPLPIGFGQTISQPYIVALMISELHLMGNEHILEIGTGSGYQTALLSHLVTNVTSLEIIPKLAKKAILKIEELGINNVSVIISDGSLGWIQNAPYDAILVSAAAPEVPRPLLEQLSEEGRMILPVGSKDFQELEIWSRLKSGFKKTTGIPVVFVPLHGKYGLKK